MAWISSQVLLFLDEINAANCMALFKTIIIDRMYGNKVIPENAGLQGSAVVFFRVVNANLRIYQANVWISSQDLVVTS